MPSTTHSEPTTCSLDYGIFATLIQLKKHHLKSSCPSRSDQLRAAFVADMQLHKQGIAAKKTELEAAGVSIPAECHQHF